MTIHTLTEALSKYTILPARKDVVGTQFQVFYRSYCIKISTGGSEGARRPYITRSRLDCVGDHVARSLLDKRFNRGGRRPRERTIREVQYREGHVDQHLNSAAATHPNEMEKDLWKKMGRIVPAYKWQPGETCTRCTGNPQRQRSMLVRNH